MFVLGSFGMPTLFSFFARELPPPSSDLLVSSTPVSPSCTPSRKRSDEATTFYTTFDEAPSPSPSGLSSPTPSQTAQFAAASQEDSGSQYKVATFDDEILTTETACTAQAEVQPPRVVTRSPQGRLIFKRPSPDPNDPLSPLRPILEFPSTIIEDLRFGRNFRWAFAQTFTSELPPIAPVFTSTDGTREVLYRPRHVHTCFSVDDLIATGQGPCPCSLPPFVNFHDPRTLGDYCHPNLERSTHFRTTDTSFCPIHDLQVCLDEGTSHIPLRPHDLNTVCEVATSFCEQLFAILRDRSFKFVPVSGVQEDTATGTIDVKNLFVSTCTVNFHKLLKLTRTTPLHPRLPSDAPETYIFDRPEIRDFINRLHKVAYMSGLDKAPEKWHFRCLRHDRLQALDRLNSEDFQPVVDLDTDTPIPPDAIIQSVISKLQRIIPQLTPSSCLLPYIFNLFKEHKGVYRWLTNTKFTLFSEFAHLDQVCLKACFDELRCIAGDQMQVWKDAFGFSPQLLPDINSLYDLSLNLPKSATSVLASDITKCFERISIERTHPDSLQDAVKWLIDLTFDSAAEKIGCSVEGVSLWVQWNSSKSSAGTIRFGAKEPFQCKDDDCFWIQLTRDTLLELTYCLIEHAFVQFGDRVWLQIMGIPMGLAISPDLCRIFLSKYEWQFVMRIMRLRLLMIAKKFEHWNRYMDDLLSLNNKRILRFLDPSVPRTADSPFWIYPLDILEMKIEVVEWAVLSDLVSVPYGYCIQIRHYSTLHSSILNVLL